MIPQNLTFVKYFDIVLFHLFLSVPFFGALTSVNKFKGLGCSLAFVPFVPVI